MPCVTGCNDAPPQRRYAGVLALETLATPAGLEPATCRLEGGCSIQLSYGAGRAHPPSGASVRPLPDAVELEIVRVRHDPALRLLGLLDAVREALALGVGDRLLLRIEEQ